MQDEGRSAEPLCVLCVIAIRHLCHEKYNGLSTRSDHRRELTSQHHPLFLIPCVSHLQATNVSLFPHCWIVVVVVVDIVVVVVEY